MMSNILIWNGVTKLDLPPDRILHPALEAELKSVVIIGETDDGKEYFASSLAGGPEVLWMLERAKKALLETVDGEA